MVQSPQLVPFPNSVELLNRLHVKDKALFLVNSGHLISVSHAMPKLF